MEDEKLKNLLKKYNKPENCPHVFAPQCNPELWNKNLTNVHKGHDIGLQKIQMHAVKTARVIDSKLKSVLCKEIVTPLIGSLAFLGLVSSELNQFRRDYLKSRLTEKMEPLAKKCPSKIRMALWR